MSDETYPRALWSHDWADAVKVSPEYRDGWVREAVANFRDKGERTTTYATGDAILVINIDENGVMSFRDCRPLRSGYLYPEEVLNPDMTVGALAQKETDPVSDPRLKDSPDGTTWEQAEAFYRNYVSGPGEIAHRAILAALETPVAPPLPEGPPPEGPWRVEKGCDTWWVERPEGEYSLRTAGVLYTEAEALAVRDALNSLSGSAAQDTPQ